MGPMHFMVFFLLGLFHSSLAKVCLGCTTKADVNDPFAVLYLNSKLQNVVPKGMEDEEQVALVQIKELKKQVVAGVIYTYDFEARGLTSNSLYECKLVVLLKEWLEMEEVEEYNCKAVSSKKQKRALPGSQFVINPENNDDLQTLRPFIGTEIGKKLQSEHLMKVVKYFKATEQIVEGSLYRVTVEIAKTNCLQNSQSDSDKCQIQNEDRQICDVQIWYRPWLNKKEVDEVNCRPQPKYCPGCPVEMNPGDVTAQQCLERALSNLYAKSTSSKQLSLLKIKKVFSQIVAGVKYTYEFDAKDKNSKSSFSCKAVVVTQPWISEDPVVTEFDCAPSSTH